MPEASRFGNAGFHSSLTSGSLHTLLLSSLPASSWPQKDDPFYPLPSELAGVEGLQASLEQAEPCSPGAHLQWTKGDTEYDSFSHQVFIGAQYVPGTGGRA